MTEPPRQPDLLQEKIREGVGLLQQGRLDLARDIFDGILAGDPNQFEAICFLGLVRHQQGDAAGAVDLLDRALGLRPTVAAVWSNRGNALQSLGRLDEALDSYDRAIALRPDNATAWFNRGVVVGGLKRPDEALQSYDRAIALRPDDAEAFYNRGLVCQDLKRFDEALRCYDRALAIRPEFAPCFSSRAVVLTQLNRPAEALQSYDRAIALEPDFAEALYNRGLLCQELNRRDQALESYDRAIALQPDHADAFYNRAKLLTDLGRLEEALASYDAAIALRPDDADALSNRGMVLKDLKRLDEAVESFDAAIAVRPGYPGAHLNRGATQLLAGNMASGWPDLEYRKLTDDPSGHRPFPQPLWLGETPLANRTLLVHYELYLGDTIQFCRYLKWLEGATVLFAPHKPLRRLMQGLGPGVRIVDLDDPSLRFDCHCPLLSLPLALGTTEATIPADVPYLFAEPDRVRLWADKLGRHGFRIGINWDTRSTPSALGRAFPLTTFLPLSRIPGVRLISLHKGEGAAQLDGLPDGMTVETLGPDLDADGAFLDTAAVMAACDLVISADTATAHLAGALGVPAWVALKYVPHWTWMLDRPDSPWYPTLRLFRQQTDGDWPGVFRDIEAALIEEMARSSSPDEA